jgi:hypothetical protein
MTRHFLKTLEAYKLIPRGITLNYQNLLLNKEVNTTIVTGYNMLDPILVDEYLKIYSSPIARQNKQDKFITNRKNKKDNDANQNKSRKYKNKNKHKTTNLFNNIDSNLNYNKDTKLNEMFKNRISYNKDTWKIPKE